MNRKILEIAGKKFEKLKSRHKGFINVGVDNWRGYRFIFDTTDVRKCQNNCSNCPLFRSLEYEKSDIFSAGLYPADKEDKKLFGKQNYLNCKTLKQYQNCYINWLLKKCRTKNKITSELKLIQNFRLIYSKGGNELKKEKLLKNGIINFIINTKRRKFMFLKRTLDKEINIIKKC